ncbi:peptidase S8 and S53, subtilisin, kexin, sedolisin [Shewanella denitrificans OS217]|uniref:Peptidase S8 and S53, subtilisin, kexin, sedolisin n=1 Tax=Shewanella denitrificans (strain OS217 / ATCC BAA-1090 / DSM 15013) TaxID=318161 RepID=Q12HY0_SHEDO|nr:S8 family peptidase [Shewanella denitrificans]ABE56946.1 peptidase S8 and S53, subtilisin, kexin, sedolisin [Shewanella denitrificans OS217]
MATTIQKTFIIAASLLLTLSAVTTDVAAKPTKKSFINDIEYTGINFKLDEQYTGVELSKEGFNLLGTASDEFAQQINSNKYLKKIRRLHEDKSYKELRKNSILSKKTKTKSPKLENWYRIDITKGMTQQEILDIYNSLVDIPYISIVELESPPISSGFEQCPALNCEPDLPPGDGGGTPGNTPDLQSYQTYLGQSPLGIDALYAWTKTGGNGQGVKIIDMENGFNSNHEDLPTTFVRKYDYDDSDHGTAVLSVVGAKRDGKGVTGIAYGAQLGFHGWSPSIAQAINNAAGYLSAGDVIILEGQINRNINNGDSCTSQNQNECVPLEWNQATFDVISAVTNRGIIVIEAAGNGNENLDDPIYQNRFNRNTRDSGAFLIAATNPSASIARSYFSNHGTRIDFNGWGNEVAAAGLYGNTLFNGGINQRYGDGFAGTSSASPIVAGAVAALQGFSKNAKGQTLSVQTIKNILTATGVQEPSGVQVGVRPNLKGAIQYLESALVAPKLTAESYYCHGEYNLSWNSISSASSYKIFLDGSYFASTTSTSKYLNLPRTQTATVQACTASSCSEHSNSVSLRYAPVCY